MSNLKVNSISNNGTAVNFPSGLTINGAQIVREYYQQATAPSTPGTGAVWYDTTNNLIKIYFGTWLSLTIIPDAVWYGSRGLFAGGWNGSTRTNTIDYVTIDTTGNATNFGNLTTSRQYTAGCSNGSRGVFLDGYDQATTTWATTIDYVTFATIGNATSFGSLIQSSSSGGACSNGTRGIYCGRSNSSGSDIEYITIATAGNSVGFGELIATGYTDIRACNDSTRGILGTGLLNDVRTASLQYITIATAGNATNFGNLTAIKAYSATCSDTTRGIFAAGQDSTGGNVSTSFYITIQTLGSSASFGNLTSARVAAGCSNAIRGVFGGGASTNGIDYVTIATAGNATVFGNLTSTREGPGACAGT